MNVKSVMILLTVVGLSACASSGPTASNTPSTNDNTQATTAQATPTTESNVICTSERALNTRFAKKTCRTAAQVEANKAEAAEVMRRQGN